MRFLSDPVVQRKREETISGEGLRHAFPSGVRTMFVTLQGAALRRFRRALASADDSRAAYERAYSSAERASNSKPTKLSSPSTQASWPGSIT